MNIYFDIVELLESMNKNEIHQDLNKEIKISAKRIGNNAAIGAGIGAGISTVGTGIINQFDPNYIPDALGTGAIVGALAGIICSKKHIDNIKNKHLLIKKSNKNE